MADRIITVTDPSVVTNDTLIGYNNYSDIDGLLGSMTPTEATNGHTVALSDGTVHEVTTKPVGTTNGEFSSVISNAVTVDLSSSYLLDSYPTATQGYSLEQLKTGVTSVIEVERDSDTTRADFTAQEITNGTLATWVGAGNGNVSKFYNQAGTGDDLIQPLLDKMPLIVNAGVLVTSEGKPSVLSAGTLDGLVESNDGSIRSIPENVNKSIFMVSSTTNDDDRQRMCTWAIGTVSNLAMWYESGIGVISFTSDAYADRVEVTTVSTARNLVTGINVGTKNSIWANGVAGGTNELGGVAGESHFGLLSMPTSSSDPFEGYFNELIVFPDDQTANRAGIENNINSRYSIF